MMSVSQGRITHTKTIIKITHLLTLMSFQTCMLLLQCKCLKNLHAVIFIYLCHIRKLA